ncbi:hypothetical protein M0R72_03025 [Candidatus Pacearchaeota archaeon]|jgi:hypothetical protein|nr:hypothetical protein [Candidatus Pacearchaeota archaeon]
MRTALNLDKYETNSLTMMGPAMVIMGLGVLVILTALVLEALSKRREDRQLDIWKYGQAIVATQVRRYTELELLATRRSTPPAPNEDDRPTTPNLLAEIDLMAALEEIPSPSLPSSMFPPSEVSGTRLSKRAPPKPPRRSSSLSA